ncbi:matrixin family metalloprotease [Archangium violaceum]|uniref:matrixin family metalloprotease n=1 Tax=Archangium violaceum TaxID=83451 RepID=UPI0006990BC0|nr:matrixin family metalloprotease [Archangium violaceum]
MESNSRMGSNRPAPSSSRRITASLLLAGIAFTPACGGGQDGAQDVAAPLVQAQASALAEEGLKRGARGPEVLKLYEYLKAYGYFPNPELGKYSGWRPVVAEEPADPQVFDAVLERALVLFQRAHGLPQDGVLNERTRHLMQQPRCGFPDNVRAGGDPAQGFTTFGSPWRNRNYIRYSYASLTPDMPASTVRSALDGAFARWSAVAGLRLQEVSAGGGDIVINFYSGNHGDGGTGNDFDGPGGVLAHAFSPPYGGHVHFDEAETWSDGSSGTDLFSVAVHEFGHALGLGHSADTSAVMYAYYTGVRRNLAADDIQGIRSLYPNNVLLTDKSLSVGQSISSKDGRFGLGMQGDGNLVLYFHGYGPLWSTGTWNTQGKSAWMQHDGNFVLYTTTTPTVGYHLWSSDTYGWAGSYAYLILQNDGNLTIRLFGDDGLVLWSSNTGGH